MGRRWAGRLLAVAAAVAVWWGLDAAALPPVGVAAAAAGVGVGLALLAWGLRRPLRRGYGTPFGRRRAKRAGYPRTLVYDVETGAWVVASKRAPRIRA